VVDIPMGAKRNHFASSFPPRLIERMKAAGVEHVTSQSLFADFDGAAEMHVAHGHHHISEFTHTLIGAEIARRLLGPRSVVARQ
jgi:hypothetical protein